VYCRRIKLVLKEKVSDRYFRLGLDCEEIAREARPGQFLMVRLVELSWEYLLSRPFSFCGVDGSRIELLFDAVGKGTRSLSQAREGAILEILGPLGNGFNLDGTSAPIVVGGGMGIAPLPFLASELARRIQASEITVLLGAKTAGALCLEEKFVSLGAKVRVSTDDGSRGHKGPVTDLLEEDLKSRKSRSPTVYACGPKPMLKTVARLARQHGVPCQASVEERMACGVGACMSCACKVRDRDGNDRFRSVCVDGPVFDATELVFDED
jgi:dihydroorotate dehydrogenase electron transfer subunit